jgi:hypothetical protein
MRKISRRTDVLRVSCIFKASGLCVHFDLADEKIFGEKNISPDTRVGA